MGRHRLAGAVAAVLGGASMVAAGGPLGAARAAGAAAQAPACPQPYLPQFAVHIPPSSPRIPTEAEPPAGPSIDHVGVVRDGMPDTDGDGTPDAVTFETSADLTARDVVIERADGTVRLTGPRAFLATHGFNAWWGDFDGDGRDDLLVFDALTDVEYLVPGTVVPGTSAIGDAAVSLGTAIVQPSQVGDQDGDGADDVVASTRTAPASIFSGRALGAPGPGHALAALPAPIAPVDGLLLGVLDLDPAEPPALVTLADDITGDPAGEFVVGTSPPIRLRTARVAPTVLSSSVVSGYLSDGHRVVVLDEFTRGGDSQWKWDLDDPCRPPSPVAAPPPPPPTTAAPITHTVVAGEWLWGIARGTLAGAGLDASPLAVHRYADALYVANAAVIGPDPNRLVPGVELTLPPLTATPATAGATR